MKKNGFTLAEVLITLLIIGVVASLTIPSVISNAQQQEFKTGLKKAVSVLNEAIQMNISQDGETPYETDDLYFYLQRHMSVLKSGVIYPGSGTVHDQFEQYGGNRTFYTTDGFRFEVGSDIGNYNNTTGLVLHESGMNIGDRERKNIKCNNYNSSGCSNNTDTGFCGSYGLANNPNNTIFPPCIILVDVNGDKKPNPNIETITQVNATFGNIDTFKRAAYIYPSPNSKRITDVFNILITDEKAIPFGVVAQRAMYQK